jgi:hypothetical protein
LMNLDGCYKREDSLSNEPWVQFGVVLAVFRLIN